MSKVILESSIQNMDRLAVFFNALDTITLRFEQTVGGEGNEDGTYTEEIETMGEITFGPQELRLLTDMLTQWQYARVDAEQQKRYPAVGMVPRL